MKKFLVVMMILVLSISFAFSQAEIDTKKMQWSARLGNPVGFGLRFPTGESNAIQAQIGVSNSSIINITGLYEWHKPLNIGEIEGLSWFFGGGAHVGLIGVPALNIGIDGIIGVEYDLMPMLNFPMSVSLDYKPAINFLGNFTRDLASFALSAYFNFK